MRRSGPWAAVCGLAAGLVVLVAAVVGVWAQEAVEVRVGAQNLADGRVELALQGRDAPGAWGEPVLPSGRYLPVGVEGWKYSSPVTVSGVEVRGAVLRIARGVRLALQVRTDSGSWGESQHPRARVLQSSVEGWRYSSVLSVPRPDSRDEEAGEKPSSAEGAAETPEAEESAPPAEESGAAGEPSDEDGSSVPDEGAAGTDEEGSEESPAPSESTDDASESADGSSGPGDEEATGSSGPEPAADTAAESSDEERNGGTVGTGEEEGSEADPASSGSSNVASSGTNDEGTTETDDSASAVEEIGGATDAEVLAAGRFLDVRVAALVDEDGGTALQLQYRNPGGIWEPGKRHAHLPLEAVGWRVTEEHYVWPITARTCKYSWHQTLVPVRIAARNESASGVRVAVQLGLVGRVEAWGERVHPASQIVPRQPGLYLSSIVRLAVPWPAEDRDLGPGAMLEVTPASRQDRADDGLTPADCYQPRQHPPISTIRVAWWPARPGGSGWRTLYVQELKSWGRWAREGMVQISPSPDGGDWTYGKWYSLFPRFRNTDEIAWNLYHRLAWRLDGDRVRVAVQPWVSPGRWGDLIEVEPSFDLNAPSSGNLPAAVSNTIVLESPEPLEWPSSRWMDPEGG